MTNTNRWRERLENFENAVNRLGDSLNKNEFSELEKDGVIQRFEFTFELAWKTLKDYLEDQGFTDVLSPKKSLKQAFENKLFENGDLWIDMLEDRNRLSHLYDRKISESIFLNIKDKYHNEIKNLVNNLKKE